MIADPEGQAHARRIWHSAVIAAFVVGCVRELIFPILEPSIAGSHAVIYTEAARAWLHGGDPWGVGPPAIVFAGPPTMLLPFVPFTLMSDQVTRVIWIGGMALLAICSLRRLRLPAYWILFPPLFGSIVLGHPEVLVLALLLAGGAWSGIAAVIKPYASLALLAQWRWRAIALGLAVVAVSAMVLPWGTFLEELPKITANLARQAQGDSTFGNPVLMAIAIASLAVLGLRRALWLATPLLWPSAQPGYKVIAIPELSPVVAILWAMPLPGATLAGVLVEAAVRLVARSRTLPAWVLAGVEPMAGPVAGATGPLAKSARWRPAGMSAAARGAR